MEEIGNHSPSYYHHGVIIVIIIIIIVDVIVGCDISVTQDEDCHIGALLQF